MCFALAAKSGDDVATAPLLCAGLIGWRSLLMAGDGRIGIYGFGAAAHIIAQVARWQGRDVYAFTRARRHRGAGLRAGSAPSGPAAPMSRPNRSTAPSSSAGRRAGAGGAARGAQRRPGGLRRNPHERHSELSLQHAVGGATAAVGRQSDAPGWRGILRHGAASGHRDPDRAYPLDRANEALSDLRTGRLQGAAVLVP